MAFKSGVKEAARMIMSMGSAGKALLEDIRKKDPRMATQIEQNLVSLEDLQYLTPTMLVGLLRDVNLEEFGLALRGIDKSISDKILSEVSTGIRLDIEDGLKGAPQKLSKVEEAQSNILKVLRQKIDKGHIVINPDGDELV